MDFKDVTKARRSCRNYASDKKINRETLEELVELANQAPSWKNSQTARYHIVYSKDMMKNLSEKCLPEYNQNNTVNACAYVVTSFVKDRAGFDREGNQMNEVGNGWGIYDLGIHNMNFILACKDRGIDSLILGLRDEEELRKLLAIPENETIISVIALGYQTENKTKPKRKNANEFAKFY